MGDDLSVEVEQLRGKIARAEKEMSSFKNKIVTKEMLENGLQMVVNKITKNNKNDSQPSIMRLLNKKNLFGFPDLLFDAVIYFIRFL